MLWRNPLTVSGSILAVLSLVFMVSLLFVEFVSSERSPYLGVFTFLVFPTLLLLGLTAVAVGLWLARRRFVRRVGTRAVYRYYPRIDLSNSRSVRMP